MNAVSLLFEQIHSLALKSKQTFGRCGFSNSLQRLFSVSCIQRCPAFLPFSIPGIEEEILGAMQQAPQPKRQSIYFSCKNGIVAFQVNNYCVIKSNVTFTIS
jgi:hypothetical protein